MHPGLMTAAGVATPRSALIVEGGAMRSVFSAGLLDGFLDQGFNPFDLSIGVSAGAANLASYLAGARGRSLRVFRDYAARPECINYLRFARGGHLIDLDWLWHSCLAGLPLDTAAVFASGRPLIVCLTDIETGEAVYQYADAANLEALIKASSALPMLYRDFPRIEGRRMADGGVADSLPIRAALRLGVRRIMVVRSRPRSFHKRDQFIHKLLRWRLQRRHPALYRSLQMRVARHQDAIGLMRQPPAGIAVVEVCPPEDFRTGRLCRDRDRLMQGYQQGLQQAAGAIAQWEMRAGLSL